MCKPTSRRPVLESGLCATHERERRNRKARQSWEHHIKTTYGITADEYQALMDSQGGRCAICGHANGKRRRLSVDHDHKTGAIRGLVCRPCNDFIGYIRDNPAVMTRGAGYLHNPPARRLWGDRCVPKNRQKGWQRART